MVEELFPALVSVVAEVDVDERVVFGLDGFFDERHAGLLRHSAAFLDVTRRTRTNNILPDGFAAQAPRDNVVER